jgi:hypothetical protein
MYRDYYSKCEGCNKYYPEEEIDLYLGMKLCNDCEEKYTNDDE